MCSTWSVEERLIAKMATITHLQHLANTFLVCPRLSKRNKDVEQLHYRATTLDRELSDWPHTAPKSWTCSVATNVNALPASHFMPSQVHKYPDFYTARVWNIYRVSRLIIQSILLRIISWLPHSSATDANMSTLERSSVALVDDICASVPFLFGHKLEKMKAPVPTESGDRANISQPAGPTARDNTSTHTGRFSLIWPLYVACSVSSVPEEQKRWMRAQLRLIAEYGEPQAEFVCSAESQMLSGREEPFRFDCV
jgi:hypothetical protein